MSTSSQSQYSSNSASSKVIWFLNSFAVLICAFLFVGLLQDALVYLMGKLMGLEIILHYDKVEIENPGSWTPNKIIALFGFIPFYQLLIGIVSGILYTRYRLKNNLRKLFFLWVHYLSLSIFGGSFITSFIDRGSMKILWEYLSIKAEFLPLAGIVCAGLLLFFGVYNLWKFLNLAPSSEINKNGNKRRTFIFLLQILPLLLFTLIGFLLFDGKHVASRFYSSQMIWIPILGGLVASGMAEGRFHKVPAFKESQIGKPQFMYMVLALALSATALILG